MDLQLQGGGDGLHADNTAEAGEGVAEVRVHLAMLYKLLLTLQGHLTDSTGSCIQALTVGHLQRGNVHRRYEHNDAQGSESQYHSF